ncbi:MAG: bifunctional UDP-N-acetylglucosamine diphosphorylase/glucosamine-1-phosphate N-acetyltransferase GlmU [Actinobacteria bacterium]|nr:bifunctional UDP-N-acetylglucosamine diphosphorylase/glucosamine-1-phosphate N-acetyltransferase GlmU [Actinomycetota bacterium]
MSNLSAAIVLAAGFGKRMNSSTPKVLHPICGMPILGHVLETVEELKPAQIIAVVGHGKERVTKYLNADFKKVKTVVQKQQKGTGHAVQTALAEMKNFKGLVLITAGDTPLLTSDSISRLVAAAKESKAAVLTADLPDPTGYGRIIRLASMVDRIVEQSDASNEELEITEINTGVYVFDVEILKKAITQIKANNKQGEIYLTDVIAVINNMGESVTAVMCEDYLEALGINDRSQLAMSQQILQQTINEYWMSQGVSMRNPDSVVIDVNVTLGQDVFLDNNTHLLGNTVVGSNSVIGPDSMLKDCVVGLNSHVLRTTANEAKIGNNCEIGPYTYLRPGTVLKDGVKAGAYVEIKNSTVGQGSKVPHLSYVGDATIGIETNIGAATVFVNYDGVEKHKTIVGDHVKIGSDTMLVAPVKIGDGAYTAAGSVITENVPAGALGVERTKQRNIEGWVARKRGKSKSASAARRTRAKKPNK